jgi:hypothetical protein
MREAKELLEDGDDRPRCRRAGTTPREVADMMASDADTDWTQETESPWILGIDPGASGGLAVLDAIGRVIRIEPMPDDELGLVMLVDAIYRAAGLAHVRLVAYLERVQAHKGWHASGAFTLGRSVGACLAALMAYEITTEMVAPTRWMRALGCLTGGDKRVTLRRARQLFLNVRITHAVADALLIAEYGRRQSQAVTTRT